MAKESETSAMRADEIERIERVRGQVAIIQEALGEQNVGFGTVDGVTDEASDFHYLFYQRRVLVRDADLPRLLKLLSKRYGVKDPWVHGLIEGVTRVELPESIEMGAFLTVADGRLGTGVVTPDHILYVTGGGGSNHACPATEPEPVQARTHPVPDESRDSSFDGKGALISVVDTGWYPKAAEAGSASPWLSGVTGDDEFLDPLSIRAYGGHGTFIAGIVRCVAPRAEVRVEGFLTHGGAITESHMITQLSEAIRLGPDVISLSAGTKTRYDRRMLTFEAFWESQLRHLKGTVLVAAAGNDSQRIPFWPAAFPWSVSVGALDPAGGRADFSNFGSWVDVYARGVDLVNAFPAGAYRYNEPPNKGRVARFKGLAKWSGTSFATPIVSGMIAARMSGTGESARHAADALLRHSRTRARPGVGATLDPADAGNYTQAGE